MFYAATSTSGETLRPAHSRAEDNAERSHRVYARTISRGSNLLQGRPAHRLVNLGPPLTMTKSARSSALAAQYARLPLLAAPPASALEYSSPYAPLGLAHQLQPARSLLNKPLCRCRVMYLGSSVPHVTKNGLHGIQEPLKQLYPDEQFAGKQASASTTIDISHLSASLGIDSWLSVWSNGLLLENVDEFGRDVRRFFAIESLHYCAAVRFFDAASLDRQPRDPNNNEPDAAAAAAAELPAPPKSMVRFLPLDAPLLQCPGMVDASHPPVFAAIMRRTTGIKVLECHAFICRRDAAANALVRCCTHAYADFLNARRLSAELAARPPAWPRAAHLSGRSKTLGRPPRSRRQDGGSAATTTNNTTSNEENSFATSSEDNYAIIQRECNLRQRRSSGLELARPTAEHRARTLRAEPRRNAHKQRRSKGSSRSLYDDFQPRAAARTSAGSYDVSGEAEKLSHSLDQLQVGACCGGSSATSDVHYSVVSSKRHSKSMQNLYGPFQYSVGASPRSARSRRSRAHRRARDAAETAASSKDGAHNGYGRKAASYQDMRAGSPGSAASIHSTSAEIDGGGGGAAPGDERRPDGEQPHAIYASGERQVYVPNNSEILMNGPYAAIGLEATRAAARGAKSAAKSCSWSRRREQSCPARCRRRLELERAYDSVVPAPAYFPLPVYAPPAPPQPLYLPAPYYVGVPGAAHQPLYASAAPLYEALSPYVVGPAEGAYASRTVARPAKSVARFRCLSPPANILSGANGSNQAPAAESEAAKPEPASEELDIVSAAPGFVSSAAAAAASGRQKKLSWIKRLSLSMSATSGDDSDAAIPSTEPSGRRKRASRLFSGSLTLGRKQHAKLLTSPS